MIKKKSNFLFGVIVLIATNLITKVIGAVYRVPLLRILGSEGLGQYQMILPIFALFLVVSSSGLTLTTSKFVSNALSVKNNYNAKKIFKVSLIIAGIFSAIFCVFFIILSPILMKYQKITDIRLYFAIAPAILFGSIFAVIRGYFFGKKQMTYGGFLQVVEAVAKLVFSLFLSAHFVKYGVALAVFGALLGVTISEAISCALAIVLVSSTKRKKFYFSSTIKNKVKNLKVTQNGYFYLINQKRYLSTKNAFKKVFAFSFFVTLQSCIMPLISAIDSLIVVPLLIRSGINQSVAYSLFGLENGVVASILALPTIVSVAVSSSIIPNIKKSGAEKTSQNIQNAFKIVWLTSVFFAVVFVLFASHITNFLYGRGFNGKMLDELVVSSDLLKINAFNIIYLCMLSISTSVLQGLEKNKAPVLNLALSAIVRLFTLSILLNIKSVNIYGTAIADMVFYSIALLLNLREIKRFTSFSFKSSTFFVLPAVCCIVSGLTMKFVNLLLTSLLTPRVLILIVCLVGFMVYVSLLFATKVLRLGDMSQIFTSKAKTS